ncbi:aldose epimerase [Sulfolobales archaeon HS-7]|nr:aldose epimerase [Sulfolobales archaeon HS-7]
MQKEPDLRLNYGKWYAEIHKLGAYLSRLEYENKNVLLPGNVDDQTHGGMANLLPFANRIKGGSYEFEGVVYELSKNREGNAIHGFGKDVKWEFERITENTVRLRTVLENPGYPSLLLSKIEYRFASSDVQVSYEIRNIGMKNAPLTVGAHPYFVVNEDWKVIAKGKKYLSQNNIPTGQTVDVNLDGNGNFDDCFLIQGEVKLTSSHLTVILERQEMPYVQIYTGVNGAVAIEPMSGIPDAFHNGIGLTILKPEERREFSFKVRVI